MRIRVVKSFGGYKAGQVFDWGDGMARILVGRGVIEEVREQPVEAAAVERRAERASIDSQPTRRRVK
jgi:hypothetical protein